MTTNTKSKYKHAQVQMKIMSSKNKRKLIPDTVP